MLATDNLGLVLAQAAASSEPAGALMGMLPIVLMFVILYFLMIRPQMKRQKAHRQLLSELAKGDEVVTAGGILGKVSKVSDNYVTVEVADLAERPVEVIVQKPSVSAVLPKGTIKAL
jgi:preprotein translocase subunit YajC